MKQGYIVGTFVREEKNRFICTVTVNGINEECYIPSSCRLENFLELAGKEVLLKENQNKNARTKLAVYALKLKRNYLILRTAEANALIVDAIKGRRFSYLGKRSILEKEYSVSGYKSDIYLPQTKTIIEVKSIINIGSEAVFPTVYSERAIAQLKKIYELLSSGYRFVYIFVSLNPYVKKVSLSNNEKQSEYKTLFLECVKKGMLCKAYASRLTDQGAKINNEITVDF